VTDGALVPFALLAELTHRCPLHCVYCSNPLELAKRSDELTTEEWRRVLRESASLGVVQTHLSGGEPLLRRDLAEIVAAAHEQGIYTQLVTSGLGLTGPRLRSLRERGLDAVQLSVQAADSELAGAIAGASAFAQKRAAAAEVVAAGMPLTLNVVLHRQNIDHLDTIVDLALEWRADRCELANVQLYNWALLNRLVLLPSMEQIRRAHRRFQERRLQVGERLRMIWVTPDYHEQRPKPCMNGWGRVSLTVAPDGKVLPCPVASSITTISFESVREHSLSWIWYESAAFAAYRGTAWMAEPCRSCDLRDIDFGGCRCQAFVLSGDAARTDPVCGLSPDHALVTAAVAAAHAASTRGTGTKGGELSGARYRRP
jgi:pyrroloquinoline quinone biosynthesis protein E